jgi:hypothetical protein
VTSKLDLKRKAAADGEKTKESERFIDEQYNLDKNKLLE